MPGWDGALLTVVSPSSWGSLSHRPCFKQKTEWKYNYDHLNHSKVIMMMLITIIVFNKDSVTFYGWEWRPMDTTIKNNKFRTDDVISSGRIIQINSFNINWWVPISSLLSTGDCSAGRNLICACWGREQVGPRAPWAPFWAFIYLGASKILFSCFLCVPMAIWPAAFKDLWFTIPRSRVRNLRFKDRCQLRKPTLVSVRAMILH